MNFGDFFTTEDTKKHEVLKPQIDTDGHGFCQPVRCIHHSRFTIRVSVNACGSSTGQQCCLYLRYFRLTKNTDFFRHCMPYATRCTPILYCILWSEATPILLRYCAITSCPPMAERSSVYDYRKGRWPGALLLAQ